MIERMHDVPAGVLGFRASGKVTQADYRELVEPLLEQARQRGERVRLLFHFGPEFERFTAGGYWEDTRIGVRYLRLLERCAVVTDAGGIRASTRAISALLPAAIRVFPEAALDDARTWLSSPLEGGALQYSLLASRGVLLLEPREKLRREDFDAVAATVDSWIETAGELKGVVIHAETFPGWEDLGTLLRHFGFVRQHHRHVRRVALAIDGRVAGVAKSLADHFVAAEVERFANDDVDTAIAWAACGEPAAS